MNQYLLSLVETSELQQLIRSNKNKWLCGRRMFTKLFYTEMFSLEQKG